MHMDPATLGGEGSRKPGSSGDSLTPTLMGPQPNTNPAPARAPLAGCCLVPQLTVGIVAAAQGRVLQVVRPVRHELLAPDGGEGVLTLVVVGVGIGVAIGVAIGVGVGVGIAIGVGVGGR